MNWARWANVVLGVWLVLSPFILNFESNQAVWNNIIVGFAVITFAIIAKNAYVPTRQT